MSTVRGRRGARLSRPDDAWRLPLVVAALLAGAASVQGAWPGGLRPVEARARFEFSQPHMGTLVRIALYAPNAPVAADAAAAAFERVAALDQALSDYRESSELTGLSSRSGSGWVEVSDDLFRVLSRAQEIARHSDGAFDVTVGPLSVLWRHSRRQGERPDDSRLAEARALVGYHQLDLDARRRAARLRRAGMRVDLGGIAKGFAADEAAAVLTRRGVLSALIAAGGDLVATGAPPDREGWRVAIASVEGANRPPAGFITLRNAAISTSGDSEQFVVTGGVRYSHIFDPRTGGAVTGRSSVSILAPNGTTADGLATAVSVMGPVRGMRLVESTDGAAAYVTAAAGGGFQTFESSRWRALSGFARTPGDAVPEVAPAPGHR